MEDLSNLTTEQLFSLLIEQTLEYTRLFHEGASSIELTQYDYTLSCIQSEITQRRELKSEHK